VPYSRVVTLISTLLGLLAVIFYPLSGYSPTPYTISGEIEKSISSNITNRVFKRAISMAWRCSGTSNKELIENLSRSGLIKNEKVKQAMLGVSKYLDLSFCGRFQGVAVHYAGTHLMPECRSKVISRY
jgi:hypothetical protein